MSSGDLICSMVIDIDAMYDTFKKCQESRSSMFSPQERNHNCT